MNTELQPWDAPAAGVRRAGVSAFGFGGTNFHVVLEEYVPRPPERSDSEVLRARSGETASAGRQRLQQLHAKAPLRGALVVGAASERALG